MIGRTSGTSRSVLRKGSRLSNSSSWSSSNQLSMGIPLSSWRNQLDPISHTRSRSPDSRTLGPSYRLSQFCADRGQVHVSLSSSCHPHKRTNRGRCDTWRAMEVDRLRNCETNYVPDVLALRIEDVEQLVGVHLLRGGEHDDFEPLRNGLQELLQMRTHPHVHLEKNSGTWRCLQR